MPMSNSPAMENELPVPPTSSSAGVSSSSGGVGSSSGCSSSGSGSGRPAGPQISVYSGIPDRQTVQVIQQALHRQPSTAAQYLQQMYAAQQQHLMLQTAALQQQHLSSAQLQSLAAVQQVRTMAQVQASLVANRQGNPAGGSVSAQTPAPASSINLAASPAAAQLINRAQSVNSAAASGIAQQAVLLGNTSSPALTASQAQMYLRAQMLIFTPTATVATVQPELGTGSPARPPTPAQVQNLTLRTQQTPAAAASGPPPTQPVLPSLALKPTPGSSQPLAAPSQGRNTAQGSPAGAKPGMPDSVTEPLKKGDGGSGVPGSMEGRAGLSRMVPTVATHPLIAPAYAQLQPHQLLSQPPSKHLQPQFVIQQQPQQPQPPPPLQQSRPAPQAQAHPQLPSVSPSLALQPSSEAHAMPLGPVTSALPLQCPPATLHKPGSSQQCHPPAPDTGPHNGYPEGLSHAPQRRFQHASAVILQLQPASPVPRQCAPDDWKEVAPGEKSVPEPQSGPSPPQQAIITAMPGGLPVPKSPNVQHSPARGGPACAPGPARPGPASGGGGRGSPAGTRRIVSAAAAALERPPRARNPAAARAPAAASRPCRPLLTPAGPVRSNAPRQPRAPARRLPADRRRPARARDPAPGGARPRGCVGPARPGPAGPWTGQCPWRGRGSRLEGVRGPRSPHWEAGTALRCHSRPGPTQLPGRASPRLSPSCRLGGSRFLPPTAGYPDGLKQPPEAAVSTSACQMLPCAPRSSHPPPPPRPRPPGTAGDRGWTLGPGQGRWQLRYFTGGGLPILEGLRLRRRVLFLI
ncbi:Polyhomeotic-like protein 2 [Galemys pyrenaicus]|uniref:Polyhomeotic-like protein 2 n=1 Tax=Galemys pyrenaicus TaxID=202257 RepID=A0A8J5ZU36_GALPY|nr:Polyhomeotic-like protein 2 [Galemys pyrenaicus]